MKKVFKKVWEFITQDWQSTFVIVTTLLSMAGFVAFAVSSCTPTSNNAIPTAYDMWNKGVNQISYESISITSSNPNKDDLINIYEKGLSSVDTSKVSVSLMLDNETELIQNDKVITIYRQGPMYMSERSFEVDFSSEESITKKIKSDFVIGIVGLVCLTFLIGVLAVVIFAFLSDIIDELFCRIKRRRNSNRRE